jgi:putative resolvase
VNGKYISASKIKNYCNYSNSSLVNWANQGKISSIRSPGGKRFYSFADITRISNLMIEERKTICYARVSSSKQKEDLVRQVSLLAEMYPNTEIITDIGSGLNYNRKGLQNLLKRISRREN